MKDDVRYSEFLFLSDLEKNPQKYFNPNDPKQQQSIGLNQVVYVEMVCALIEDLYVKFNRTDLQLLVGRLRGEVRSSSPPSAIAQYQWENPRLALFDRFLEAQLYQLSITYRGMRRIEELRDLLKRDRILDDFGILLSIRYVRRDLYEALRRSSDVAVSVLYLDMDDFGKINKQYGQSAGDEVMKSYLEIVRESIGDFGTGYRGVGDETVGLIVGQGHAKAMEIAETIKRRVGAMQCEYKAKLLPRVTTSIGVATTPPESRSMDIETLAESRKRVAKGSGKNCVIGS
jgi:diguanylate cyclase (GGDEF)-like protein